MSRVAHSGGTKKWCPACQDERICAAVNPSQIARVSGQRWHKTTHTDLHWFRRGLVCQTCGHEWLTAEVEEDFLDELVELRDALGKLKSQAKEYAEQSEKAAKSLGKLTKSLDILRALDI